MLGSKRSAERRGRPAHGLHWIAWVIGALSACSNSPPADQPPSGCDVLAAGTPCATPSVDYGICRAGECVAFGCGDGVVEGTEVCDDGNRIGGDGCSANCDSLETCGNGVIDPTEQCDDGKPTISGDGCSASCGLERDQWTPVEVAELFFDPIADRLVYDQARGEITLVGNGTWRWDGDVWHRAQPASATPSGVALAYDSLRARVLLLGSALWAWDGLDWRPASSDHAPPDYVHATMAYDEVRDRVVMTGETLPGQVGDTTWEWDGSDWRALASPPPCVGSAMTFDPIRHAVVMACLDSGGVSLWSWTGAPAAWAPLSTLPARGLVGRAFDRGRGTLVMTIQQLGPFGELAYYVEEWDGASWTARTLTPSPQIYRVFATLYDLRRAQLVVLTHYSVSSSIFDDAGTLGDAPGADWTLTPVTTQRPALASAALAYDSDRDRAVSFGGVGATGPTDATWEYDGVTWGRRTAASHPTGRSLAAAAYDADLRRVVLFGGVDAGGTRRDDTWEWDGAQWSSRILDASPAARSGHGMVYDPVHKRVVLFGGTAVTGEGLGDTWEYDGTSWSQLATAMAPSPRAGFAMVFDDTTRRIVLFGGAADDAPSTAPFDDTWELDGKSWREASPATRPPARVYPQAAYEASRGRVVMVGGAAGAARLNDTWEWSGTDWIGRRPIDAVYARSAASTHYDPIRRRLIMFGGGSAPGVFAADGWAYAYRPTGHDMLETCRSASEDLDGDGLAGCLDPDCWGRCAPQCPPRAGYACDPKSPRCGDGVCNPDLEDAAICPADCH